MRRTARWGLGALLTAGFGPATAEPPCTGPAAWAAFERTLRAYYAYLERPELDVAAVLAQARDPVAAAQGDAAVRAALLRATYAFADPHLLVGPIADDGLNVFPTSSDLVVAARAEAFIVTQVRAGSPAAQAGVRPGWQVTAVDGQPLAQAVAALHAGVVARPSPAQRDYAASLLVNGRRAGERRLTFQVGDQPRTLTLGNPRDFAKAVQQRPPVTLTRVGDSAVLRFENSLGDRATIAAFDAALKGALDARALVIDLRNTPSGGNTDVARAVIGHFIDRERPYQRHRIPGVERETTVPRVFVEWVAPRAPRFTGPVAVLGGPWTGSMGEGLVIGLHAAAGARTFAPDMGDLLGALHRFPLGICGATVELGAEHLSHVDGTPREAYVADVPLEFGDLNPAGEDAALAAALAWLAQQAR
ncbi:MAG: hypothetical protein H6702_17540 [Myxococcales bacterium]|nr:hypothetical protein [Myxococcales bacterium]